mgnify:CR=1 FL=1
MFVHPTQPKVILEKLRPLVAQALSLEVPRVFLAPDPTMLGRMPPAADLFAAVVFGRVRFPDSPQHPGCWPAEMDLATYIYSRQAVDRPLDMTQLMTNDTRGLLPLADRLLSALAGQELAQEDPPGRLLRGPLQCSGFSPVQWGQSGNLVLAYLGLHWVAPFEYAIQNP